jgi:hypothetical protein
VGDAEKRSFCDVGGRDRRRSLMAHVYARPATLDVSRYRPLDGTRGA